MKIQRGTELKELVLDAFILWEMNPWDHILRMRQGGSSWKFASENRPEYLGWGMRKSQQEMRCIKGFPSRMEGTVEIRLLDYFLQLCWEDWGKDESYPGFPGIRRTKVEKPGRPAGGEGMTWKQPHHWPWSQNGGWISCVVGQGKDWDLHGGW